MWYVDVRLSLALSEIVLLLGGDIEKNPGPGTGLTGIHPSTNIKYLLYLSLILARCIVVCVTL